MGYQPNASECEKAQNGDSFLFQGWPRKKRRLRNCYGADEKIKKGSKKVLPFVERGRTSTEEQQHGGVGKKGILPSRVEMGAPCQTLQPNFGVRCSE